MKRLILFITLTISSFSLIDAQQSLLWEISGKGLKKPSYLFGTIHIICADDFELGKSLTQAMENSQKLVLEVDITDPEMMKKAQAGSINKNFRNFKVDLTETDRLYLDSCLKADLKVGIDQLGILKPWALMTFYSMTVAFDCADRKQYETELASLAKSQNKPLGQLETFEFQLGIFDSIPMTRQLEWLMETVREKEEGKATFEKMITAYKSRNLDELNRLTLEDEDMKELADVLFYQRNTNWLPVIIETAQAQPSFFAVGAGHLGGKGGVIDLLKQAGYKVKPIK